jgi:hypothetical protein
MFWHMHEEVFNLRNPLIFSNKLNSISNKLSARRRNKCCFEDSPSDDETQRARAFGISVVEKKENSSRSFRSDVRPDADWGGCACQAAARRGWCTLDRRIDPRSACAPYNNTDQRWPAHAPASHANFTYSARAHYFICLLAQSEVLEVKGRLEKVDGLGTTAHLLCTGYLSRDFLCKAKMYVQLLLNSSARNLWYGAAKWCK